MIDDEQVMEGYSPPTFSAQGFTDESTLPPPEPEVSEPVVAEIHSKERDRRKRVPSNRRVDQLLHDRGALEQHNTFLAQQALEKDSIIAEQQRKLQELQGQIQNKETETFHYFDAALESEEENLTKQIKHAKEEGNIDLEVNLFNKLAEVKAKKTTSNLLQYQRQENQAKQQNMLNEEPYVPIETYVQPPSSPPLNPEFQEWVEENPWYTSSPRLGQEADTVAADLADRLAFNEQADMIGTPEFYQSITNIMSSRYGLKKDKESEEYPTEREESVPYTNPYPTHSAPPSVAPVTRRGISMADQYVQNKTTGAPMRALTKEEFAIARHLPIRARGETEADLVRRFAQAKNYPDSPLPGGTPHRLTIL